MGKPFQTAVFEPRKVSDAGVTTYAFLLAEGFSPLALAAAVETLATANETANRQVFRSLVLTQDGLPLRSSAGFSCLPDAGLCALPRAATLVIVGGARSALRHDPRLVPMLRREAIHGRRVVGLCDAVEPMALAGLLDEQECAIHWRDAASFGERFPLIEARVTAYVRGRHSTVAGCASVADFFLDVIAEELGRDVAQAVADQITHRSMREGDAPQTASQTWRIGNRTPWLAQIIQVMERNIEEPLAVAELADLARISVRQLERQFVRVMGETPVRFYNRLRLERARDLLAETDLPLSEIAMATGFSGLPVFSRQFRKAFGHSPSRLARRGPAAYASRTAPQVTVPAAAQL